MENNQEPQIDLMEKWRNSRGYGFFQLLMFIFLAIFTAGLFSFAGIMILEKGWGITLDLTNQLEQMRDPAYIWSYRFLQLMNGLGAFIAAPLLFSLYNREYPSDFLGLKDKPGLLFLGLAAVLGISFQPVVSFLLQTFNSISLPAGMESFEKAVREEQNKILQIQTALVGVFELKTFLFNTLLIAIIPAIGEELVFRKIVLRFSFDMTRNSHVSILISAFLFALVHNEFFNFPALLAFGVLLGYLAYWSGSIWIPVLVHFINNFVALCLVTFQGASLEVSGEGPTGEYTVIGFIAGILISSVLIWAMYRKRIQY